MDEMVNERDDGPPPMYLATSSGYDEHGETCNTECELALSRACRDGDFKRFTELANEKWTVRTLKYRVDLLAAPDQTTPIQETRPGILAQGVCFCITRVLVGTWAS